MRKVVSNALGAFWLTAAASPAFAQPYDIPPSFWHYGWGWGHMIFGSLLMIVFLAGVILLVVLVVRWLGGPSTGAPGERRKTALEILQERFARGEIDKEEYEERKRTLSD